MKAELPVVPAGFPTLPRAYGGPFGDGRLRTFPEDFVVDEELGFVPDGAGQHVLLQIRKRSNNTEWLARQLARVAGVGSRDVGYAGLKDRNAVTSQWFSIDLAGKAEPDWQAINSDDITVLAVHRHGRKLRRGSHRRNRFQLVVREVDWQAGAPVAVLDQIGRRGVPNYFGEQRFGRDGANLAHATALFRDPRSVRDRHQRGLYLSAARSLLFNRVLAARVAGDFWDRALPGDVMNLDGSRSAFLATVVDAEIEHRLAVFDIHPTGPLWGRGELAVQGAARDLELQALTGYEAWCDGLVQAGLEQERRPLRLPVTDWQWQWEADARTLRLQFALPRGGYATTVLSELLSTSSLTAGGDLEMADE